MWEEAGSVKSGGDGWRGLVERHEGGKPQCDEQIRAVGQGESGERDANTGDDAGAEEVAALWRS